MKHDDQDMIVMYNKFNYDDIHGNPQEYITSLVYHGTNQRISRLLIVIQVKTEKPQRWLPLSAFLSLLRPEEYLEET